MKPYPVRDRGDKPYVSPYLRRSLRELEDVRRQRLNSALRETERCFSHAPLSRTRGLDTDARLIDQGVLLDWQGE